MTHDVEELRARYGDTPRMETVCIPNGCLLDLFAAVDERDKKLEAVANLPGGAALSPHSGCLSMDEIEDIINPGGNKHQKGERVDLSGVCEMCKVEAIKRTDDYRVTVDTLAQRNAELQFQLEQKTARQVEALNIIEYKRGVITELTKALKRHNIPFELKAKTRTKREKCLECNGVLETTINRLGDTIISCSECGCGHRFEPEVK